MEFIESDYEYLHRCPWCSSVEFQKWGKEIDECKIVKCNSCNLVYAQKRLGEDGLYKYWKNYLSHSHRADEELTGKREIMYKLDFDLIYNFFRNSDNKSVLDVGCSGGYFLDLFSKKGFQCYGVEFGEEAAIEASQKYKVWLGKFFEIHIEKKFDLIVFRGVLQYFSEPKKYLDKAVSLLNDGGYIYITATPNVDSICSKLFKDRWNMAVTPTDFIGFSTKHFDEYFNNKGFDKIIDHEFYEETPYASVEDDILKVAEAVRLSRENDEINFKSPAFWGNMMTLVYRKRKDDMCEQLL